MDEVGTHDGIFHPDILWIFLTEPTVRMESDETDLGFDLL
jgi:hypothetical protein